MATSLTDDYSLTRDQIIRSAFETIGVASANEPLDPVDIATAKVSFNALAMSWKAHGLQLWKRGRASVTLVASTYSYELTPTLGSGTEKPMRLLEVNRKDTDGNEIDLTRMSLKEYESLPNKTTTGVPTNFYFEPSRLTSILFVWPAPSATEAAEYTIEYIYQAPIQDMNSGTEDVDFPNEWYRALILNLAVDLAPKYGLALAQQELLSIQAMDALDLAKDYDVEDTSWFIMPDMRGK